MAKKFEIFISYRRKGGYDTAKLLYDRLRLDGYAVSFDIDTLEKGDFDDELENRVRICKDFLLVLNPGVFDRFYDPECNPKDDWVRREIACALEDNKNIVPLFLDGFVYPKEPLPPDVKDITRKNGIDLNPKHFESAYAGLKQKFLISQPRWTTKHKKKIITASLLAFLAIAAYLYFAITQSMSKIANQNELEIQLIKRQADSMAQESWVKDSIIKYKDSVAKAQEQLRQPPQSQSQQQKSQPQKSQPQKPQPASSEAADKKQDASSSNRGLHWAGSSSDRLGNVIYEKLISAGVKKTPCSDNGIKITPGKANCGQNTVGKVACSYAPKLTLTYCNGNQALSISPLEMPEKKVKLNGDSENKMREEIESMLRSTDFSQWVSAIKSIK